MRKPKASLAAVWAALAAGTTVAQTPQTCDRACLEGIVNQYIDALVAHNPFGLPLARKVKFTENDVVLDLGDGVWNTITGAGSYKLILADPQSGQVGVIATMRENSSPIAIAARIKIENRKITELETVINRGGGGPPRGRGPAPLGAAELLEQAGPDRAFMETAPAAQRASREALIAAANQYFDAIEKGSADPAAFDKDCNRVENGARLTNSPNRPTPAGLNWNPWALGCAEQINTKMFSSYKRIYPRRFPVVDEERQLVFGFFMYQQPGDLLSVESPGHGIYKFPDSATQPGFVESAQLFRIKAGKIANIESLTLGIPYGMPDPFFKDDWRRP
jgi:hypothetical protein